MACPSQLSFAKGVKSQVGQRTSFPVFSSCSGWSSRSRSGSCCICSSFSIPISWGGALLWLTLCFLALLPPVSWPLLRVITSLMMIFAGLGMRTVYIILLCLVITLNLTPLLASIPPAIMSPSRLLTVCRNCTRALRLHPRLCSPNAMSFRIASTCSLLRCRRLLYLPKQSPGSGSRFTVADTGATNHMFPDKSMFKSYTRIPNLQVWMGNNSYLPVLGRGTPIIFLNGQQVLVHHALHVPCPRCGGSSLQPSRSLHAMRL